MEELSAIEPESKSKERAWLVGFLTGTIPIQKAEGGYENLNEGKIRSKVKELYEREEYNRAEKLIETLNQYKSSSPKKEIREIKSKSFRLSGFQFVKVLKKAYGRSISAADVLRANISERLKSELKKLGGYADVEEEKISLLKDVLEDWASRKSRAPLSTGYDLKWEIPVTKKDVEAYNRFSKYFLRKRVLEKNIEDPALVDVFLKHYEFDEKALFDLKRLNLNEESGNIFLSLTHKLPLYFEPLLSIPDHDNWEPLDSFLSEVANEGFEREELKNIPIFKELPNLAARVERINEEDDLLEYKKDAGITQHVDELIESEYGEGFVLHPPVVISHRLDFTNGTLNWGGNPLEEDLIKKTILSDILGKEIKDLDIGVAKSELEDCLAEGNTEEAQKISRRINVFKSSEVVAKKMGESIQDGISSQVVSLTMPKGLSGLIDLFDLKKEEVVGD